MALNSINTNIAAYFAQQNINKANSMVSGSVGRLSSGNRIVRASDDVAAMSVGTSLRTTVSTLKVGLLNASQGTSMLQVADGALGKMQDMLLRQKALATQATSGSLTSAERGFLNQEFQNLTQEIDRLVETTNFNGVNLLGGTLGNATDLAATDAIAAALAVDATNNVSASALAFEAFDVETGNTASATAGALNAGELAFVDAESTALTNSGFLNLNQSISGAIGQFSVSNVVIDASASLSVTINGIEFSGSFAHNDTEITLSNGNNYIAFGTAAFDLSSLATANAAATQMTIDFSSVEIMQTSQVSGVDFTGTALEGVTFAGASSTPMLRLSDPSDTSIKNFQYVNNTGADANVLSVEVGGETFYATVTDAVNDGDLLTFTNGEQGALQIDLTGLTTDITDIRTSSTDRKNLIDALNTGFANIGGGVDFALGTEASDKLTVSINKSDTSALYGNASLNVSTIASAQLAGDVLNTAIDMVTAIRADVGALMSRFDFATANIEIAMQNQDAARGTLLDTDVAAESSAYATAQVQLQAGIAVLAQANQLPQNLLKLIG